MGNLQGIFIQKGRQLLAQLSDGPEEKTFDRADGDVQDFRCFVQFESVVVTHHKYGSFLGGYFLECLENPVLNLG